MSPQRHRIAQQQLLNMTSNSANRHPVSDRGSRAVHTDQKVSEGNLAHMQLEITMILWMSQIAFGISEGIG